MRKWRLRKLLASLVTALIVSCAHVLGRAIARRSKRFTARSTSCRRRNARSGSKTARAKKAHSVYYSISAAELMSAYVDGFMNKVSVHQGRILARQRQPAGLSHDDGASHRQVGCGRRFRSAPRTSWRLNARASGRAITRPKSQNYPREQYDKDGYFHADSLGICDHRL